MLDDRYKKILLYILQKHFPEARIYLFGSQATGKARPGSDVDIALDEGEKIELDRIFKASQIQYRSA